MRAVHGSRQNDPTDNGVCSRGGLLQQGPPHDLISTGGLEFLRHLTKNKSPNQKQNAIALRNYPKSKPPTPNSALPPPGAVCIYKQKRFPHKRGMARFVNCRARFVIVLLFRTHNGDLTWPDTTNKQ